MPRICARCCIDLTNAKEDGISSIYSDRTYLLCAPCFDEEYELIERQGTNNLPGHIRMYKNNLKRFGL